MALARCEEEVRARGSAEDLAEERKEQNVERATPSCRGSIRVRGGARAYLPGGLHVDEEMLAMQAALEAEEGRRHAEKERRRVLEARAATQEEEIGRLSLVTNGLKEEREDDFGDFEGAVKE